MCSCGGDGGRRSLEHAGALTEEASGPSSPVLTWADALSAETEGPALTKEVAPGTLHPPQEADGPGAVGEDVPRSPVFIRCFLFFRTTRGIFLSVFFS